MMSSGPRTRTKLLFLVVVVSLLPAGWCAWQILTFESILKEGYFVSSEIAYKTADQSHYKRSSDGSNGDDFEEAIGFGHWNEVSFYYDGEHTVEFHYDGRGYSRIVDERPKDEWSISFGDSPVIYIHQLFHLEGDPLRIGTLELDSVRLEAMRAGRTARIIGQTTVDGRIYDVKWSFSPQ